LRTIGVLFNESGALNDLIAGLARFVLKVVLVVAGLVLAASLLVALAVLLAFWLLRAAWARLTGRPVAPFVMRFDPRGGFDSMVRRAGGERYGTTRRPGEPREIADITDVEPKEPR
jgi:hypothetical protein